MKMKYLGKRLISCALLFSMSFGLTGELSAATILYQHRTSQVLAKGVTYEFNRRLQVEGWLDIHTIKMDLADPYVYVAPVESKTEYAYKETTQKMLNDNGAIAGINGDFFGMAGSFSQSFGPVIRDGNIISVGSDLNAESSQYAAFMIDQSGNAFFHFLNVTMDFYVNGSHGLSLSSINKAGSMTMPTYIDRNAYESTKLLDNRFAGLVKVVVENDMITYVSQPSETVNVPEDGFVICMTETTYNYNAHKFGIGRRGVVQTNATINLDNIDTAIGGGGMILVDGAASSWGMVSSGRQPRTAIGVSQDQKTLILMVVDGRSHSIGVTNKEMAEIMLSYGAYNAVNLDGGGSTTMAVKSMNGSSAQVVNTPSDGSQRRVINALGIFDDSPVGEMVNIGIKTGQEKGFVGAPIKVDVVGYDDYLHEVVFNGDASLSADDANGTFQDGYFYPSRTGDITFTATYNGQTVSNTVKIMEVATLSPSEESVQLSAGGSASVNIYGISKDNVRAIISGRGLQASVYPEGLATVENGKITALSSGSGYVQYNFQGNVCYVKITVGSETRMINALENDVNVSFKSYPETVSGSVFKSNTAVSGDYSIAMNYTFNSIADTQAAYIQFDDKLYLGNPSAIQLNVFGDNSGHWLRGRLVDANGKEHTVDFASSIDWTGWKEVSAAMPQGVVYPVSLDRVYAATTSADAAGTYSISIDKLTGTYAVTGSVSAPQNPSFLDLRRTTLSGAPAEGSFDITIAGGLTTEADPLPEDYITRQQAVLSALGNYSSLQVMRGDHTTGQQLSVQTLKHTGSYATKTHNNVFMVSLAASQGGLKNTSTAQWQIFKRDIINAGEDHVVIVMDKKPQDFTDKMEYNLFHAVLQEIADTGMSVTVVSTGGTGNAVTVTDGIRYIHLGDLWNNGSVNQNFSVLRLRFNGKDFQYDLQKVFS